MGDEVTDSIQDPTAVSNEDAEAAALEAMMAAQMEAEMAAPAAPQRDFSQAAGGRSPKLESGSPDLDFILDLPLEVTVELGRASMLIGELLQLGQGSVVELNKLAGESIELLVNHKVVAKGEAVVVNEKFGIRITDVVPAEERVRKLG
ncbi:MAG: flagellar motor switch protein FliN [Pseudomonadota bacterium]